MTTIYTVGHSSHTVDDLLAILAAKSVRILVDVRSRPYSKWHPQFRKDNLESQVARAGLRYRFLGRELGGMPDDDDAYRDDGTVDYALRARSAEFASGLDELLALAEQDTVAILCAEEDPTGCHRRRLITPALLQRGVGVIHLRGDGRAQSDQELDPRQLSLFGSGPDGYS